MRHSTSVSFLFTLDFALLLLSAMALEPCRAEALSLYTQPAYESPVRGDPDDLLMISGNGLAAADTVVYQALDDTTQMAPHPSSVPTSSTVTLGVLDLVSSADAPYSLTMHLPTAMAPGAAYGLWVVTPDDHWSGELRINDARPLWITPDSAYQTATLANLPRVLKVVGRNLQADGSGTRPNLTQVRLVGLYTGTIYILPANNTESDPLQTTAALERYVAAVNLPATLTVDQYTVQVSRDGGSWVSLLGNGQSPAQTFTVNADPPPPTSASMFDVSDPQFADPLTGNSCQPDDGIDATGCIILAIRAAQLAGGGTVTLRPGTWLLTNPGTWGSPAYSNRIGYQPGSCPGYPQTCGVSWFGVTLPQGVNLQGAGTTGSGATIIRRGSAWLVGGSPMPAFVLQGNNVLSGIAFQDATNYSTGAAGAGELQLGYTWYFAHILSPSDPVAVSNVVITNSLFVQPYIAISGGGLPIDHLYVTENTFGGAYITAINVEQQVGEVANLTSSASFPYQAYHFSDTVIDYNTFYPSSYVQTAATYSGGGSIASEINTGLRADFSGNVADGTVTQYLYNPATDPKGWRAAYFWSTGANQEMTLVSNNVATCPGDKYGDGEGIVYDGGVTQGGVPAAEPVIVAVPWTDPQGVPGTTLTFQGTVSTILADNNGNPFSIATNPTPYYQGFWVQVVQGTGKGQWRKVESLALGDNDAGSTVTLNVTPAFDVLPDATSEIVMDHAYWQNATVNNYIDQRTPLCTQANARASGGTISWYASTADSAIEGNQQYATTGVMLHHVYLSNVNPVGISLQSFNEVRNNLIDGAYGWSSLSSDLGGIQLGYGAYYCGGSSCASQIPPVLGFGVSVARNTIIQADGKDGDDGARNYPPIGAIGLGASWSTGPIDSAGLNEWPLGDTTLVFHNTLQKISETAAGSLPGVPHIGIGVDNSQGSSGYPPTSAVSWRTTMYANTCSSVDLPVSDLGIGSVRYCPAGGAPTCECGGIATVDVAVAAAGSSGPVSAGTRVTYTATITNNSTALAASNVSLLIQPSAGVQISGATFAPSQGSCDSSVSLCALGSLAAGSTATVSVTAILPTSGNWPATFSVTHGDADPVPQNDSVVVTEMVQ